MTKLRQSLAGVILALVVGVAIAGPWLAPRIPGQQVSGTIPFAGPSDGLPLGTDYLARDLWTELLNNGRPVVLVPLLASLAATALGGTIGILAALATRPVRRGLLWLLDVAIAVPPLLVLLVLVYRFGPGYPVLGLAVVAVTAPYVARYTRSVAQPIAHSGYVEHAASIGASRMAILVRDVLPNVAGPLLADAGVRFVASIYLVATASFLGFGSTRDWASMIEANLDGIGLNVWAVLAPAIAITAIAVPANLLADHAARRIAR